MTKSLFRTAMALEEQSGAGFSTDQELGETIENAGEHLIEANSAYGDVEHMTSMASALEDLAAIADTIIGEPSQTEKALMGMAGQLITVGTDVQAEELVPSMEGYTMEAFSQTLRDKAKILWQTIKRQLALFWEKIKDFFNGIFGVIPRMEKQLEATKERVKQISSSATPRSMKVEYKTVREFSLNGKVPKNGAGALELFGKLNKFSTSLFNYGRTQIAAFNEYASKLSAFKAATVEEIDKSGMDLLAPLGKLFVFNSGDSVGALVGLPTDPQEVPGSKVFSFAAYSLYDSESVLGHLHRLSAIKIHFRESLGAVNSYSYRLKFAKSATLETLNPATMMSLLDSIGDTLKETKEFIKIKNDLYTAAQKVATATSKLMDSFKTEDREVWMRYQALAKMNQAITQWGTQPYADIVANNLKAVRAGLRLVDQCAAEYSAV
jgi:hypothetical protein